MSGLKLPRLPDRTPVKLTIMVTPELHRSLSEYAAAYEAVYGQRERVVDLVPHMLQQFIANDRAFAKARESNAKGDAENG